MNHTITILATLLLAPLALRGGELAPTSPNPGLHYYYEVPRVNPPQTIKVDVGVYGGAPGGLRAEVSDAPNILILFADDIGYEALGAYGGLDFKTPNLDRMAAKGFPSTLE
jgi:hypothetical protein